MNSDYPLETTRLLHAWASGDQSALDQLTPRVYKELRRLAQHFMEHEFPGGTLQATALVHEAYIRLIEGASVSWQDRAHFFAVAARLMRHILIDAARTKMSEKRGGKRSRVNLNVIPDFSSGREIELLAVDDALNALALVDRRKAQIVEMRFFGGFNRGRDRSGLENLGTHCHA